MPKKITVVLDGTKIKAKPGVTIQKLLESTKGNCKTPLGAIVNQRLMGLYRPLRSDSTVSLIDYKTKAGANIYRRSVSLIMCEAFAELYPQIRLEIGQSIGGGYFYSDKDNKRITKKMLIKAEKRMLEFAALDRPMRPSLVASEEAIDYFTEKGYPEKAKLIKQRQIAEVPWVILQEFRDVLYGPVVPSGKVCNSFALIIKSPGFILKFPYPNGRMDKRLNPHAKLFATYRETRDWNEKVSVWSVSQLNQACIDGSISDIIKVSEGLQEKKIAWMADEIYKHKDRVRLVLIAGPSSSGKTTFTKRLAVQLRVNRIKPLLISMDNYYVDREKTPKLPNGNYDFESIEALDLDLFNRHLGNLLSGKEIKSPIFDFVKGIRRSDKHIPLKMCKDQVLLIEGIHGLNPKLTSAIANEQKFRIYVSALTQLAIDDHNRIFTSDMRLMRRMVRDRLFRGYKATQTIRQWPSVRAGENKHIFPYQEEADVMFDTALVYEPAVLKPFLRRFLSEVDQDDPEYMEAYRLTQFLNLFIPIFPHEVPSNSLMREFIGGSSFDY